MHPILVNLWLVASLSVCADPDASTGWATPGASSDYRPATLIVSPFKQPAREFLPGREASVAKSSASVTDRFGHRYTATRAGMLIEGPGGARHLLNGKNGLAVENLSCVALAPNGDVWLGSTQGAIRWTGGQFEYYAGRRWLPDDRVQGITFPRPDVVDITTPVGVSRITFKTMTLADKARHYDQITDARHKRRGYVYACNLMRPGDLASFQTHSSANDGLWTGMYGAAQAFRYAATKSLEAKRKARESLLAILDLESKSGIPGYPARAVVHKSEWEFGTTRGGEWHRTANGEYEWKGDTSSDEIMGHYFAWGIYHDLVADAADKARLRETVRRVTDNIVDNGFYLLDVDGLPTRWGVWAPEKINDDPEWRGEKGLNSLHMLSHLKVAHHITGDEKYERVYRELIEKHRYALNLINQKVMPSDFPDAENNHSDDEHAFLSYYGLLRYERDPSLRALYLASLERSWQIERPEKCPLWNVIYGALTGLPCDAEATVESLQEIPLDLIYWRVRNGHRADLKRDPRPERGGKPQLLLPLPWRERPLHKWNGNPYEFEGGSDSEEECGTFWLLPYWMGRHYRIFE